MTRKEEIIQVSKELFMQYGIRSVSMDDVCRKLGISKKTLYGQIETKSDLVECAVLAHEAKQCMDMDLIVSETTDALEAMVNIGNYIIRLIRKIKPGVIYDLQKYYRKIYEVWDRSHSKYIHNIIVHNLNTGIQQGYYRADLNIEIIARLYVGKSNAIINEEIFPPGEFDQEEVVRHHLLYHLHGILTDKGVKKLYSEKLLNKKLKS